jgi:hypothetical protein
VLLAVAVRARVAHVTARAALRATKNCLLLTVRAHILPFPCACPAPAITITITMLIVLTGILVIAEACPTHA